MIEKLKALMDQPVVLRTVPEDARWEPIRGVVFDVTPTTVDILIGTSVMKTVRIAAIIDVVIDEREARRTVLEAPPDHPNYPAAKRLVFEAENLRYLGQPAASVQAKAAQAAELLRGIRAAHPKHLWTEQMLERTHFLATDRYDYEVEASVTGGELNNHNYRWAKERLEKLDEALRMRRPEDEIAGHITEVAKWGGRALGKYPNHADLKAWFEKAEKIRGKLSEDVRRSNRITEPFLPGRV